MIQLGLVKNKLSIKISGDQFYNLLSLIKSLPSRKWDPDNKVWLVDVTLYKDVVPKFNAIDSTIKIEPELSSFFNQVEERKSFMRSVKEISDADLNIPGWKIKPYPFQNTGIRFLSEGKRSLLADSVGLGKTVQSVGAALRLKSEGLIKSVLIVCPKSVIDEWEPFIHKNTDYAIKRLDKNRDYAKKALFNITSYDTLVSDLGLHKIKRPKHLSDDEWKKYRDKKKKQRSKKASANREEIEKYDVIILDEAHRCSHSGTKRNRAIKLLAKEIPYLFLLSATPLQNKLDELYALFSLIDRSILGTHETFKDEHYVMGGWNYKEVIEYKNLDKFNVKIAPYTLRRTRDDVKIWLPPKTEVRRWTELGPEQQAMYNAIKERIIRIESDPQKEFRIKQAEVLAQLQYLRQVCLSTHLIDPTRVHSSKLDLLQEVVEDVTRDGNKMIVYCFFKGMCELIRDKFDKKYGVVYLHGDNVQDLKKLKEEFATSDKSIFLMTRVGGEGLNLDMANYFIFVNPEFNPKIMEQLAGRIDRLTQKKPMEIIHLLAKDTYEERIVEIIDQKDKLFDDTVEKVKYESLRESELIRKYI